MNLTDMKCAIKFLGWTNTIKQRESMWKDEQNNSIAFGDHSLRIRLNGELKRYPYIGTDFQEILNNIMETVKNNKDNGYE